MKRKVFFSVMLVCLLALGFALAGCGGGGGGGSVTFNVTNNYSSKAVSVRIDSNVDSDDTTKTIDIAGSGGKGSFSANLTKVITGDYMGQLYFKFEGNDDEYGPDSTSYSFDDSKSTFNIVINSNGKHYEGH